MTDSNTSTAAERAASAEEAGLSIEETAALAEALVENVERVIVDNREQVEHVVTTVLARGHVLLDDVPGVGKTMLARSLARSIDASFNRIQFTPDLLPSDITGVNVYNQASESFEFQSGPVFAHIVLGDEINRAPPKTQSALLEAMEEQQVSVDGQTRLLPDPFTVVATQNAVEPDRTYELPLAELDRFTKKLRLGYPSPEAESELLARTVERHPIESLEPVTDVETLRRARRAVAGVTVREAVRSYATRLAGYTREHASLGVSPRGTIALLRAAQARAVLDGREYVIPDDVQTEAPVVLSHRVRNTTESGAVDGTPVVEAALERVPTG